LCRRNNPNCPYAVNFQIEIDERIFWIADHTLSVASRHSRANVLLSYASEVLAKQGFMAEMNVADKNFTELRYSSKDRR
jgi:hypothetical protein